MGHWVPPGGCAHYKADRSKGCERENAAKDVDDVDAPSRDEIVDGTSKEEA